MKEKIRIFKNREIPDLPFPEITIHTHDGINSPVLAPQSIDTLQIKTGAVGELALEDGAVTKDKVADDAIWTEHLHVLAVTKEKIAVAAVEWDKIANEAVKANNIWTGGAVITLSAQIKELIVQTGHIQDLAVVWAKIGNLSVGNSKIMNAAISEAKIDDLAVTTAKINDLAVEWAKIGNLAVGNSKIMNLAVTNAKINDLSADKINVGILTGITVRTLPEGNQRVEMDAAYHSFLAVDASAIVRCQITSTGKIIQRDSNVLSGELWQGVSYDPVTGHSDGGQEIYKQGSYNAAAEVMLADLGQAGLRQGAVYVGGTHFAPMVDNAMDCGSPSYQWNDVYCHFIKFPSSGGQIIWNGGIDMDWYSDRIDFGKTIAPYVVNCDLGRATAYWRTLYVDQIINPDFIDFAALASHPSSPGMGTMHFDTSGKLWIYDGANWKEIKYV